MNQKYFCRPFACGEGRACRRSLLASALRYSQFSHSGRAAVIAAVTFGGRSQAKVSITVSGGGADSKPSARLGFHRRIWIFWCMQGGAGKPGLSARRASASSIHKCTCQPSSLRSICASRHDTPMSPKLSITVQKIQQTGAGSVVGGGQVWRSEGMVGFDKSLRGMRLSLRGVLSRKYFLYPH